jgi:hypothetical protein
MNGDGVSHEDFVAGVKEGTMNFVCLKGEPRHLLRGARGHIFGMFVLLYTVAPILAIPAWAFQVPNGVRSRILNFPLCDRDL